MLMHVMQPLDNLDSNVSAVWFWKRRVTIEVCMETAVFEILHCDEYRFVILIPPERLDKTMFVLDHGYREL